MNFKHISVLLEASIENLNIKPHGIYVDGTLGGGGHSSEILQRLSQEGLLIGVDQDQNAILTATEKLKGYPAPFQAVRNNFSQLPSILDQLNISKIDGLLLDLGVSSHQLDEAERGFSYMQNAPLDMRMDNRSPFTAWEVVNHYEEAQLEKVIRDYGEEKWAKRIASFIVAHRREAPIEDTFGLVDIIKKAIPKGARMDGPHPAKRTFQAIRIEVNGELEIIEDTIVKILPYLNKGARICIITFHSLEDRIVKNTFRKLQDPCVCPPKFPICQCGKERELTVITRKPIVPSESELEGNPRSRSAKLRVAEKW